MEAYFLLGLGNPGKRYQKTRHNLGFWLLDRLEAWLAKGPIVSGASSRRGSGARESKAAVGSVDEVRFSVPQTVRVAESDCSVSRFEVRTVSKGAVSPREYSASKEDSELSELSGERSGEQSWLVGEGKLFLLKPLTFMNLSGRALAELGRTAKIRPSQVCVLHDELDLEPGAVRIKFGGGLAGHNGLRSVAEVLGSRDFYRIRLGIGRPKDATSVSDFVLRPFEAQEEAPVGLALERAEELFRIFLCEGLRAAQSRCH